MYEKLQVEKLNSHNEKIELENLSKEKNSHKETMKAQKLLIKNLTEQKQAYKSKYDDGSYILFYFCYRELVPTLK